MIRKTSVTPWATVACMPVRLQRSQASPVRVLSYDRVSGAKQLDGRGLARQAQTATLWCERNGLELDTTLRLADPGRSASKGQHLTENAALGQLLRMVERGEIEPGTILLVEAIDRLSRMNLMHGLRDVIFKLVEGGVRIITLEDECEYSLESIENDWTKVLLLVVRVQAAYEYTKRLSMRIRDSWHADRQRLAEGKPVRTRLYCPRWCDYTDGVYTLNEKAKTVQLVFELARSMGCYSVARELNERGIPTLTGRSWTPGTVRSLITKSDNVFGVLVTNASRRGPKYRAACEANGICEQRFEGIFPVCVPEEDVQLVRNLLARRDRCKSRHSGPVSVTRWIGRGLSFCDCGAPMTTQMVRPRRGGQLYYYLRCKASTDATKDADQQRQCNAKAYRLKAAAAHVLTRLRSDQLQRLVPDAQAASDQSTAAQAELEGARAALEAARAQAENAQSALQRAIREGWDLGDFYGVKAQTAAWVAECEQRLDAARACVDAYSQCCRFGELTDPVRELFTAVANDEESAEQRKQMNEALRGYGLQMVFKADNSAIGLQFPGGPLVFEPFDLELSLAALGTGMHESTFARTASGEAVVFAAAS